MPGEEDALEENLGKPSYLFASTISPAPKPGVSTTVN